MIRFTHTIRRGIGLGIVAVFASSSLVGVGMASVSAATRDSVSLLRKGRAFRLVVAMGVVTTSLSLALTSSAIAFTGFTLVSGAATDVSVGADGTVWAIGTAAAPGGGGNQIFERQGSSWNVMPGGANEVSVAPNGSAWVVNSIHQIFHWNGSNFTRVPGAATDVSVGADGTVWAIGTVAAPGGGGNQIFERQGSSWNVMPGGATEVSVAPNGSAWVVNSIHQIFHWNGSNFTLVPGAATDVSVGADGTVWAIGTAAAPGGGGNQIFERQGSSWNVMPGGANEVSVAPNGSAWVVNSIHQIFQSTVLLPQTIDFTGPASGTVGTTATLHATPGGSDNPVIFSVDSSSGVGVCRVSGSTVSYLASGTCVIDANEAGNQAYSRAPQVSQGVSVTSSGYDMVGSDGGVFVFPTSSNAFYGSLPGLGIHVNNIVGMEPTNDYHGYDLVGSDGGVFVFPTSSNAFYGSLPGLGIHVSDIVGIAPTSDDRGYLLVGADGGVFKFGDAHYINSLPGMGIHVDDIIGISVAPSGAGYWLIGADGSVYSIGVPDFGEATGTSSPVSAIQSTPDGGGYWIVTQDGTVYPFGDAQNENYGDLPDLGVFPTHPVVGLVPTISDNGYWLIGSDGGVFAFPPSTPFVGSLPGLGVSVNNIVGAVPTIVS